MAWIPILDGAAQAQALEAVEAIAWDLAALDLEEASLGAGSAGLALFFGQLALSLGRQAAAEHALSLLERALDAELDAESLLGGGLGVVWALERLGAELLEEGRDPAAGFTERLRGRLPVLAAAGRTDLASGLAGAGVLAAERAQRGRGLELMEAVVDALAGSASRTPEGCAWPVPAAALSERMRDRAPQGLVDLGLAHGQAGVVALLGEALRLGARPELSRRLLDGAVSWLRAQRLQGFASDYPTWVGPGLAPEASRVAWCYGDLGIAMALLSAARAAGREDWEREALGTARRAALRRGEDARCLDAGFCHGFAGAGHLFNRLHQATGDAACLEAARHWFDEALAFRRPGEGVGGYRAWHPIEDRSRPWLDAPGLIEGAAGIGLALLAAAAPQEPHWDRALLPGFPPPGA